jgi:transcription-repair coupling factor (mfd)
MNIFNIFDEETNDGIIGLTPELRVQYTYNYFNRKKESVLFVCSSLYESNKYYQKFLTYTKDVVFFPMDDFLTSEALAISPEFKITRLEALRELLENNKIVVTNLMGYLRYLPSKKTYEDSFIKIKVSEDYSISETIEKLYSIGYSRETIVNKTGEMALRGYVIDLFPVGNKNPVRIEFWGDTVDSIREFNIDTQLTINKLDSVLIAPNTEFLTDKKTDITNLKHRELTDYITPCSILDYIENGAIFFNDYSGLLSSYTLLADEMKEFSETNGMDVKTAYMNELTLQIKNEIIYFMNFDNVVDNLKKPKKYNSINLENFVGSIEEINKRLNSYLKLKNTVIICISTRYKADKLINDLDNKNIIYTNLNNIIEDKINVINFNISEGYILNNTVVISEKEIFNKKEVYTAYKTNFKIGSKVRDINKLNVGDYIVHNVHGIGRYCGIKTLMKNGLKKDYLMLEYKGEDKLYIPVEKLEFISKYSSSDGIAPKLNKLGGIEWHKTKLKARAKIEDIAGKLLTLYAERENSIGFAFKKDEIEQAHFESEFIYEETDDQLRVIEEIKKDMEKKNPMDRLLCGDVGYGKTEVAFRAIFKAIMSGKQVALLCPTTILSSQHFNNAKERFKSYPVEIALMNRFVSAKEQKKNLEKLKEGKIDLLIGTHRILSEDIEFKNLGLLIIDEEQRFGVKHKEKIKEYKTNIDVLTLSATPIPRTLQMSMTGIRSLSLIETPPTNRYPIQTYVLEENRQVIKDAIYKEMARNGQAFILYNSIEDMESKAREINSLVPEAKIVCAHGRMDKKELEDVMIRFMEREYDVLLCTTIIETGIDIPSVNTLIIIDAECFGLSQLYQIRGRVGRSNKIAYCYLMYNKGKTLTDVATKRLNVIKEFTELGSGFSIAMRDLSIRGAGDILGSEQAGFVDTIGVELFLKMLNDEVDRLKGIKVEEEEEIDTPPLLEVSTTIDDKYVSDEELKIEIHQKINKIENIKDLENIKQEVEDRFGSLTEEILIYMYEELFENTAKQLNIKRTLQTKNSIAIHLPKELTESINGDQLFMDVCSLTRKFRFGMKNKELIITLDTVTLDKHYIYYLLDMLDVLKKSIK